MKDEISVIINGVRYDVAPKRAVTGHCVFNCDLYEFCQKVEERTRDWIGNKELRERFSMSEVCSGLLDSDKFYFRKVEV